MNVNNVRQTLNNAREFIVVNLTVIVSKTIAVAKPILNREFVCGFIFGSAAPCFIAKKYSLTPLNLQLVAIAIISGIVSGMGCMAIKACLKSKPKPKPYDAVTDRLKDWNHYTEFAKDDYNWDDSWGESLARSLETEKNCCAFPKLAIYIKRKDDLTIDVATAINNAYKNKYGENDFTKENRTLSAAEVFRYFR